MKTKIFLLIVCSLGIASLQAQKLDWFSLWGSSTEGSHIRVNRMAVDSEDNVYVVADFCGNAVSVEDQTLVSKQGSDLGDAVLAKMTPAKEVAWIRTFSESRQSKIYDVVVDGQDNIIVAGTFTGTINPAGNNPLEFDDGEYDDCTVNAFIARFDSDGALLSQWRIPAYELTSLRVAVDVDGNVYVAGTYGSYILFTGTEEGVGTFSVDNQLFLAKYSPAGVLLMSKYTAANTVAYSNAAVQVDTNGDIYVAGTFTGTLSFADKSFSTDSDNDMFLAKYSASGSEAWAKRIGGSGSNEKGVDLVISPLGDVAVGGTIMGTSLTISDVDSTFAYLYGNPSGVHSAVTTFTKEGAFRWQYWYGYSTGTATLTALRCSSEGVYYLALYCDSRAGDISTGTIFSGQNSGMYFIDGQPINHNTNGGADALYLVLSPEGGLCNYSRPGGAQTEWMKDIAISSDKKSIYFLYHLCVRKNKAHIPLDNFFVSFVDIDKVNKLGDFTSIAVPCPETVAAGGSYSNDAYINAFYSGCLLRVTFPEIAPNELPSYTDGTPYSQTLAVSELEGTLKWLPLNMPDGLSFNINNGQLTGTITGKDTHYVTLIASDTLPRYSYFTEYASDPTWLGLGWVSTRGNSRNVRNFILRESTASGLKDVQSAAPRIFYPTVVTDAIQVNTEAQQFTVNIYSMPGARVLTASDRRTIGVKALSPGIYLAEIVADGQRKAERIIIK